HARADPRGGQESGGGVADQSDPPDRPGVAAAVDQGPVVALATVGGFGEHPVHARSGSRDGGAQPGEERVESGGLRFARAADDGADPAFDGVGAGEGADAPQFLAEVLVGVGFGPDDPPAPAGVARLDSSGAQYEAAGGGVQAVGGDDRVELGLGLAEGGGDGTAAPVERGDGRPVADGAAAGGQRGHEPAAVDAAVVAEGLEHLAQ